MGVDKVRLMRRPLGKSNSIRLFGRRRAQTPAATTILLREGTL